MREKIEANFLYSYSERDFREIFAMESWGMFQWIQIQLHKMSSNLRKNRIRYPKVYIVLLLIMYKKLEESISQNTLLFLLSTNRLLSFSMSMSMISIMEFSVGRTWYKIIFAIKLVLFFLLWLQQKLIVDHLVHDKKIVTSNFAEWTYSQLTAGSKNGVQKPLNK